MAEAVEQRQFIRYPLRVPIIFNWRDAWGRSRQGAGFTRDISTAGVFVLCSDPPPTGADLSLEALLPPLETPGTPGLQLRAKGRVLRVELEGDVAGFAASSDFGLAGPVRLDRLS